MSEWGKCQAVNCTLGATIQTGGHATCSHHYQVFDRDDQIEVSERIKRDKIRSTYNKVCRADNSTWATRWLPKLLEAKTPELRPVEISEGVYETQSLYLARLYKAMDKSIQGLLEVR